MTKREQNGISEEEWMEALLTVGEDEKMTPKQSAIMQAAAEIFAEKGYSGAATSEIARKAGVAEGTIFRYYKTKKDLLLSIVVPGMSRMLAPFMIRNFGDLLTSPFDSYETFLRALIRNRMDFTRANSKIVRILIQEIPFHEGLRQQFVEQIASRLLERIGEIVEHFKEKGELVDAPTPAMIRFTLSSIFGFLLTRMVLMPDREWKDDEEIELLVSFLMHGIAKAPGQGEDQT